MELESWKDKQRRQVLSPPSSPGDLEPADSEPDTDGELEYSTPAIVSRITSPTPSLTFDESIMPSHRSMPDSPYSENFSPISESSRRSSTPSPVKIYQVHDRYNFHDDMDEFLVRYV